MSSSRNIYKEASSGDDEEDESNPDCSYDSDDGDKTRRSKLTVAVGVACLLAASGFLIHRSMAAKDRSAGEMAENEELPLLEDGSGFTTSWNFELVDRLCIGREKEGLPVFFDEEDEDEDDESEFGDEDEDAEAAHDHNDTEHARRLRNRSPRRSRRLKSAHVAVDGIRRFALKGGGTMPYYGSADLQQEEASGAEFAMFVFHGAVRDAINYFCAGTKVLNVQTKYPLNRTLLIVLKWHYAIDEPIPGDVWWNSSKPWGSWMAGGHSDAKSGAMRSSFGIIDEFVTYLANNPSKYPRLKEILLMGHSAGGQTLHRYAFSTHLKPPDLSTPEDVAANRGTRPEVDVRFLMANPSSYLYLDHNRWAYSCGDNDITPTSCTGFTYRHFEFDLGRHGWQVDFQYGDKGSRVTEGLGTNGTDFPFICRTHLWNNWFYGLNWEHLKQGFIIPYLAEHPNLTKAVELYPHRDVVYLVGQNDTCWDDELSYCDDSCWTRNISTSPCYRNHMDMRCPAMLQGPNRKTRAFHYQRHLYEFYGRKVHALFEVPGTGHEGGKILTSSFGVMAIEGTIDEIRYKSIDPLSVPLGTVETTTTVWSPPTIPPLTLPPATVP